MKTAVSMCVVQVVRSGSWLLLVSMFPFVIAEAGMAAESRYVYDDLNRLVRVERALDMFEAAKRLAPGCDLFIGVAAVADYRPATVAQEKIKKKDNASDAAGITLDLLENPDIIASIAQSANPPVVIGFAAETNRPLEHAREKLKKKRLHAIVVNDVSQPDIGFNVEENAATFVWAQGETKLAKCDKYDLACTILEKVSTLFADQLAHTNPADVAK